MLGKILIVDDDLLSLEILENILSDNQYEILSLCDSTETFETVRTFKPDLILLDIQMPKISGFDVCKKLKKDQTSTDIPILFISCLHEKEIITEGFKIGGVDYVNKPFDSAELIARVKTHLKIRKLQQSLSKKVIELKNSNDSLEKKVELRTQQLLEENHQKQMLIEVITILNGIKNFEEEILVSLEKIAKKLQIYKIFINEKDLTSKSHDENCNPNTCSLDNLIIEQIFYFNSFYELPADCQKKYLNCGFVSGCIIRITVSEFFYFDLWFTQNHKKKWDKKEIILFRIIANMVNNAFDREKELKEKLKIEQKHNSTLKLLEKSTQMASLGVMAAGITHEINQPLNAIKVTADSIILFNKRNPANVPEIFLKGLNKISRGVNRIDEIVQQMRGNWIQTESKLVQIDINQTVMTSLRHTEELLKKHNIILKTTLCSTVIYLNAIKIQFEQIIINIIANAINALNRAKVNQKQITLSIEINSSKSLEIRISDNGTGIDESKLGLIFDPLFSTTKNSLGTGLGLAIVKNFVTKFRGKIRAENNVDGGASFIILFPFEMLKIQDINRD